jgi:hypothetical protein
VNSEGKKSVGTAVIWLARKELEDAGAPDPKIGDVFEFWGDAQFKRASGHRFWDVDNATPTGNIVSSSTFVMWRISAKSRSSFDAQRKIENTRV